MEKATGVPINKTPAASPERDSSPTEGSADALRADHVVIRFGGLVAVNDVSFVIPKQSVVSLIGPNGAGKTTFFNILTGLYRPGMTSPVARRTASPRWAWRERSRTSGSST